MSPNAKQFDILGLGVAAVDDLLLVESFPRANDKMPVLEKTRQGGGLTATALVAAARLGCACHYIIALGADELSAFLRDCLSREGLVLHERRGEAGLLPYNSTVITERDSGERIILWSANGIFPFEFRPEDMGLVAAARCLFVDNVYADKILAAAREARRLAIPVVGDFESTDATAAELIGLTDHCIMPLGHAARLTGESRPEAIVAALMRTPGRALACVTDSERGCWFAESGHAETIRHQPAFKVDRVVDTCGCGDVFHGAYAASLVKGLPAAERVRRASAAAAIKAGKAGSQLGAPALGELEAFLAKA